MSFEHIKSVYSDISMAESLIYIMQIGEIKLGTLKGVDAFGNKYYEVKS